MKIYSKVHRERFEGGVITPIKEVCPSKPMATGAMSAFDLGLKDGECILDTQLLSVNGWLNQQGELYACGWLQHDKSVKAFGYKNERDASKAGLIRLASMKWQIEKRFAGDILISEAQYITIIKWHKENNLNQAYFDYCYRKLNSRNENISGSG